jgi:hypothetical protein
MTSYGRFITGFITGDLVEWASWLRAGATLGQNRRFIVTLPAPCAPGGVLADRRPDMAPLCVKTRLGGLF